MNEMSMNEVSQKDLEMACHRINDTASNVQQHS